MDPWLNTVINQKEQKKKKKQKKTLNENKENNRELTGESKAVRRWSAEEKATYLKQMGKKICPKAKLYGGDLAFWVPWLSSDLFLVQNV